MNSSSKKSNSSSLSSEIRPSSASLETSLNTKSMRTSKVITIMATATDTLPAMVMVMETETGTAAQMETAMAIVSTMERMGMKNISILSI